MLVMSFKDAGDKIQLQ